MQPSGPSFGSGGSGGGFKVGLIVLVVAIGAAGYFIQATIKTGSFKDISSQVANKVTSAAQQAGKSFVDSANDTRDPADATNESLTQKLNAYVDLLNTVSSNVFSSYDRYGLWVDLEKGPTGKEPNVYGLYQFNDYSSYLEAADKASALTPQIDLDKDFPAYKAAYLKLKPLADEAYAYYDQEDYKDDNFAKGQKLHPDLVAAFKEFEAASTKFAADYEVVDVAQRKIEMDQYQKEGRTIAYNAASALYLTQQMYMSIRDQLAKNGNDASLLDANDLKSKTDQFDALLTTLKLEQNNEDELKKEYGSAGASMFSSFVNDAQDTLKAAKSLYRGVRDKNLPERDDFADNTDGTPENYIYTYNQMVDSFNRLNRF